MFQNHIVSAFRNLVKHKGFSFIHIGGLVIGLTAGIFVLHYAKLEYSYDDFHQRANRTYRITTLRLIDGIPSTHFASTFAAVGPALKSDFPEVEAYTRFFKRHRGGIISHETTRFRETDIWHADSGFFKVFSFPLVKGSMDDFHKPGSAFIEERMVTKYFGDGDPIGKRITFGSMSGVEEYEIRGIIRCPESSSIKFNFIFNYHDLTRIFGTEHESNWAWLDFHTFLVLKENADLTLFDSQLNDFLFRHIGDRAANGALVPQPLTDIYLKSKTQFETGITGNETTVRVLLILGIIILVIVAFNFINLSTSRSLTRAKEVGIRKALGSSRQNLITQFLLETGIINLVAVLCCLLLIALLLPEFSELTQRHLEFLPFLTGDLWKYMTLFLVIGTIVIGFYPALMLSSFRATEVLKGFFSPKGQGAFLREAFVSFQAVVSFSLVASILIVVDQVSFINQKELGITIDQTLVVRTPDVVTGDQYLSSLTSFKGSLLQDSRVIGVTATVDSPGAHVEWIGGTRKLSSDQSESYSFYRSVVDEDFLKVFGLGMISGSAFTPNQSDHDIIVNEQLIKTMSFPSAEESIGQQLLVGGDTFNIVGVIEDFHQVSPREAIAPTIYHYMLESPRLFMIRYESSQTESIVQLAENAFHQFFPNVPFDYYFLDEYFEKQYDQEKRLTTIISVFCVLAVVVSTLGLLGLTWFRLARQKKELAIRKIIGSTDLQLFINASRRLLINTTIGCIIGIPLTWYVMAGWLETFSYHTHPKLWEFALALVSSLLIALLSISGHTLKVIRTNPVNHLRQE